MLQCGLRKRRGALGVVLGTSQYIVRLTKNAMSAGGTVVAVMDFPAPWPPLRTVTLFAKDEGGTAVALVAESDARLIASVCYGGELRRCCYGPLDLPDAARVILTMTWTPDGISLLSLDGRELSDRATSASELGDPPSASGVCAFGPIFPNLQFRACSSEEEELFLHTVIDIDQKVTAGDRYSVIRASGLLRQLLLDETPLVHAVNRQYRLQLSFQTVNFSQRLPVEAQAHWRTLDPEPFLGRGTQKCSLKQFLAAPCLAWNGRNACVSDLIRACANAKGGIHFGRTKIEDEQMVLDFDQAIKLSGEEPSIRAIAAVCRVSLRGLNDLVSAIQRGAA
jgi:hypothetical protein